MNDAKLADVVIAGGGFAGLALAVAVGEALGPRFGIVVADPKLGSPARRQEGERPDLRASAIAAAPRRMFEALRIWPDVADEAQPILEMVVTDSRLDDVLRPAFLTFAGDVAPGEPFAHMIENVGSMPRWPRGRERWASTLSRFRCKASRPMRTG